MSSQRRSGTLWQRIPWSVRVVFLSMLLAAAVAVFGVAVILISEFTGGSGSTGADSPFTANIALRYETQAGQFALLEISPFQVGKNTFRVTVLDESEQALDVAQVTLEFSRLERAGAVSEVDALPARGQASLLANYTLTETGWWAIDVGVDGQDAASFYLRLDDPSRAPLTVAPPDYESEPAAEALFRETLARYENLSSLRWSEELTSGLGEPKGVGVWVVTNAEAVAPDRLHLRTLSPGSGSNELYRVGETRCSRVQEGGPWQCSAGSGSDPLDRDYMKRATAFRLGRRESVDGEMTQVLLFYNPGQSAWYAWWIGESTSYLRRQAMVAPGHFMLTRYVDHNAPINIQLPEEALRGSP